MTSLDKLRRPARRAYTLTKRFVRDEIAFLPRRLTAEDRVLPDFLLIGSMKCGTTSLFFYLSQHPQVIAAYKKGVHYFDSNYDQGEAWYRAHFPRRSTMEALEAETGKPVLACEGSPYYMFHPRVPALLHETVPQAKLLALLRDPVERAFSHYNHNFRAEKAFGQLREPLSFLEALEQEDERLAGERERMIADPSYNSPAYTLYSYKARGVYVDQLEPFAERYGKDRLLVLRSRDFYSDPQSVYDAVTDYLGLDRYDVPDLAAQNVNSYSRMDPAAREHLETFFEPHNRRLAEFLGREPFWTYTPNPS